MTMFEIRNNKCYKLEIIIFLLLLFINIVTFNFIPFQILILKLSIKMIILIFVEYLIFLYNTLPIF